jgi:hypothetical protein
MFKQEEAYQYALCMDLTPDHFQFAIIDPKQKKILHHELHDVSDYSRDGVKLLLDNPLLKHEFATYSLSSGENRNTLIPSDLFSYSKPGEIFKLNYPEPIGDLDYNRISELGIVNIYEFPLWIKSLFVIGFPRVKIVHRSTVLLKGVFDQPTYSPKIHLFVEDEQFYMQITEKSKLTYFNRFDYKEIADLVYYVLFVLEQKEYDQSKFDILFYGLPVEWAVTEKIQDFFSSKVKISDQKEKGSLFILAKQLLCV